MWSLTNEVKYNGFYLGKELVALKVKRVAWQGGWYPPIHGWGHAVRPSFFKWFSMNDSNAGKELVALKVKRVAWQGGWYPPIHGWGHAVRTFFWVFNEWFQCRKRASGLKSEEGSLARRMVSSNPWMGSGCRFLHNITNLIIKQEKW